MTIPLQLSDLPELPLTPLRWGQTYTSSKDGQGTPLGFIDIHRRYEEHAGEAYLDWIDRKTEAAKKNYALAAEFERYALNTLLPQAISRGFESVEIIGVSATACYYKAGDFEKAAALAGELLKLSDEELPKFARLQLTELKEKAQSNQPTPSA